MAPPRTLKAGLTTVLSRLLLSAPHGHTPTHAPTHPPTHGPPAHQVLEGIFPRHILEYLTLRGGDAPQQAPQQLLGGAAGAAAGGGFGLVAGTLARDGLERLASLATSHACVTILFTGMYLHAVPTRPALAPHPLQGVGIRRQRCVVYGYA